MPYGTGPIIRRAFMGATPWQRYLIGVAVVVGGSALVVLGHFAGVLLAVTGAFLLWRMVRSRLRRSQARPDSSPGQ